MKLIFKFGYIHIIKWLIMYKENPKIGTTWAELGIMYSNYWKLDIHKQISNLNKPKAIEFINNLKKL